MRIAFLVNLLKNHPSLSQDTPKDFWYELDDETNIPIWRNALIKAGHDVCFVEGNSSLPKVLNEFKPNICFNTCEGYRGDSREAQIPALLEMLSIPYTGAKPLGMAITLDKPTTKAILSHHGLQTPKYQVFYTSEEELDTNLKFPLFVKPSREGTGIGIEKNLLSPQCHN